MLNCLVCVCVFPVCRGLIKNGERQDEESMGGRRRTEALRQLCQMNPSQALNIRAMVVSHTHTPLPLPSDWLSPPLTPVLLAAPRWRSVTCRAWGWP